jgi:hypothetical protein
MGKECIAPLQRLVLKEPASRSSTASSKVITRRIQNFPDGFSDDGFQMRREQITFHYCY